MSLAPVSGAPNPDGADSRTASPADAAAITRLARSICSETDDARLTPDELTRLTVLDPRPPGFRFVVNEGGALDVSVEGRFPCAIYPRRPEDCRLVEPGSPCCLGRGGWDGSGRAWSWGRARGSRAPYRRSTSRLRQDDRGRRDEDGPHDDGTIPIEERGDTQGSDARPPEKRLGHHRPADERAEVDASIVITGSHAVPSAWCRGPAPRRPPWRGRSG